LKISNHSNQSCDSENKILQSKIHWLGLTKYSVLIAFLCRSLLAMMFVLSGATVSTAGITINPVSLQAAIQFEEQALKALSNAEEVVIMARDINDGEAVTVATEAVQIANDALKKARKLRSDLEKIASAIKKRQADEETGTVSAMQGDVYLRTSAGDLKIEPDFILQQGDEIVTGSGTYIELTLQGGSHITLGENSSMTVTQMNGDFSFSLALGKYMAKVRNLRKRHFRVHATFATAAVRGTEFEMEATTSGTSVTVRSGVVEVTPTGGKAVMVNAGWRFHVDSSGQGELESTGGLTSFESDINALQIQTYHLAR